MIEISQFHYFLSSSAEIFGAFIGLLAVVYVYKSETLKENVTRQIGVLGETLKKNKNKDAADESEEDISDFKDLKRVIEKHRESYALADYKMLLNIVDGLELFSKERSSLRKSFQFSIVPAFVVLMFSLMLMAMPPEWIQPFLFPLFLLHVSLVFSASLGSFLFINQITKERNVFHLSSN